MSSSQNKYGNLEVSVENETSTELDLTKWCDLVAFTLKHEGVGYGSIDLAFVEPAKIAELNSSFMGKSGPTDVLAFPLDSDLASVSGSTQIEDLPLLLGDVVVCYDVAETQANVEGWSIEAEVSLLVIHGVLHILGHDHMEPEETRVMRDKERFHLNRVGFPHKVDL